MNNLQDSLQDTNAIQELTSAELDSVAGGIINRPDPGWSLTHAIPVGDIIDVLNGKPPSSGRMPF
jgi:hypothetical protein